MSLAALPRRVAVIPFLTLLCFFLASSPGPLRFGGPEVPLPYDEPGAAQRYYLMKRASADGRPADAFEKYQQARKKMQRMPRFSSRSGRRLPSLDEVKRKGGIEARSAVGEWEKLGPGNVGGRTRALLLHPGNPDIIYAGGVSGGIWKTADGGQSWLPLADFLPNIAVNSMAMDPSDPQILYAGTGEGYFREVIRGTSLPLRGAGIFKSIDAGESWQRLENTDNSDFHWVNDLAISSLDPQRIYAATRTGLWRSLDGGQNWTRILNPQVNGGCFHLALRTDRPGDNLLASCGTFAQSAIWFNIAAEGNLAWLPALSEVGMGLTSLAIAPSNQNTVYALSASYLPGPGGVFDGGLHAVFRSNSGGAPNSWQAVVRNSDPVKLNTLLLSNPLIATQGDCFGSTNRFSTLGWYTNLIAVDPVNPEIVWAGGVDLFRSDDGGRNWGPVTYWWRSPPSAHADHHAIVFHPDYDGQGNQTFFLGNDGGVWRTDSARAVRSLSSNATCDPSFSQVDWTPLNHDYGVTQFYHGEPLPDGSAYLGGTQDNGTQLGSQINDWQNILGGDGGYVAVDPNSPNIIYAESQFANFAKSTDGGQRFVSARAGITDPGGSFLFITPFRMDPGNSQRLWTGGLRMWRTTNGMDSWNPASSSLQAGGKVSAIAVSKQDGNRVLAGLNNGFIHRQDLALTASSGTDWPAAQPRQGFVSWLAFDPVDPDIAYAAYAGFGGSHVWKSSDGGTSWASIDGDGVEGLPDIPVHALMVDPNDRQRIYLGTDLGVLVSSQGGMRWAVEHTGFPNTVTESLFLNPGESTGAKLYAFTHGRGAWRVTLAQQPPPCQPERWIVHVTPQDVAFTTTIFATNFSNQDAELTLVPYTNRGLQLALTPVAVPAGESIISLATDLFGNLAASHFGICGPSSIAVSAGYRITTSDGATAHVTETSVADRQFLFYPGEQQVVFEGLGLINLGSQSAQVSAVLLDESGTEIERIDFSDSVAPRGSMVTTVSFLSEEGVAVRIESSELSAIVLLRGTQIGVDPMLLYQTVPLAVTPRQ